MTSSPTDRRLDTPESPCRAGEALERFRDYVEGRSQWIARADLKVVLVALRLEPVDPMLPASWGGMDGHDPALCSFTPPAEGERGARGDREAIARIVDPEAWLAAKTTDDDANLTLLQASLAKADAILALSPTPPASPVGEDSQGFSSVAPKTALPPTDGTGGGADKLVIAREAFLNLLADAKRYEWQTDGDTDSNGRPVITQDVFIHTDSRQFEELAEALGIKPPGYMESWEDAIDRAVEAPVEVRP